MSTALQLHSETMGDWAVIRQQAEVLVKTGFLPQSIKTPEQAMAIILTGRELGIGAMAALNTINVIQGKPTVSPQLMLALINRSGQVEDIRIETGPQGATCTIKRKGRTAYTAKFGPNEAAAMQLSGKDNYKKQGPTMYKWRAVADAARATFADVLLGLYTPDEMGAATDVETGEVVEVEAPTDPFVRCPTCNGIFRESEINHGVCPKCPLPSEVRTNIEPCEHAFGVPGDKCENCGERVPESKPRGGYHETLPEAPPEPVRTVKLEGAQPKSAVGPKTQEILNWMHDMGWEANDLANYIYSEFQLSVDEGDAVKAINALSMAQRSTLHQKIKGKFESRR